MKCDRKYGNEGGTGIGAECAPSSKIEKSGSLLPNIRGRTNTYTTHIYPPSSPRMANGSVKFPISFPNRREYPSLDPCLYSPPYLPPNPWSHISALSHTTPKHCSRSAGTQQTWACARDSSSSRLLPARIRNPELDRQRGKKEQRKGKGVVAVVARRGHRRKFPS